MSAAQNLALLSPANRHRYTAHRSKRIVGYCKSIRFANLYVSAKQSLKRLPRLEVSTARRHNNGSSIGAAKLKTMPEPDRQRGQGGAVRCLQFFVNGVKVSLDRTLAEIDSARDLLIG